MKRLLIFAGVVAALTMASRTPARADAYVDPPSFGRIVFGMTEGMVVLPQEAWEGAYPDGSGTPAVPNPSDAAFGGGPLLVGTTTQYFGDLFGTPGSNTGYDYAGAVAYNGGNATSVAVNPTGVFSSCANRKHAYVFVAKLGFVGSYSWESQIGVYGASGGAKPAASDVVTLLGAHTSAGTISAVHVSNPYAFEYWSDGTATVPAFDYYSDNSANNSGYPANQLYSHFLAYQVTDPTSKYLGMWFIGFEDTNFNVAGAPAGSVGYHRFDFNDTVIEMTDEVVPEPAFYQLGALIALGGLGLLRMTRCRG